MSDEEHLRRELRFWKWLFWMALLALVVSITYSGWRRWELRQRVDGIEEGYMEVATRCLQTLQASTDWFASGELVCAAVPRLEAVPPAESGVPEGEAPPETP